MEKCSNYLCYDPFLSVITCKSCKRDIYIPICMCVSYSYRVQISRYICVLFFCITLSFLLIFI